MICATDRILPVEVAASTIMDHMFSLFPSNHTTIMPNSWCPELALRTNSATPLLPRILSSLEWEFSVQILLWFWWCPFFLPNRVQVHLHSQLQCHRGCCYFSESHGHPSNQCHTLLCFKCKRLRMNSCEGQGKDAEVDRGTGHVTIHGQ